MTLALHVLGTLPGLGILVHTLTDHKVSLGISINCPAALTAVLPAYHRTHCARTLCCVMHNQSQLTAARSPAAWPSLTKQYTPLPPCLHPFSQTQPRLQHTALHLHFHLRSTTTPTSPAASSLMSTWRRRQSQAHTRSSRTCQASCQSPLAPNQMQAVPITASRTAQGHSRCSQPPVSSRACWAAARPWGARSRAPCCSTRRALLRSAATLST